MLKEYLMADPKIMPELPEVETIRRDLEERVIGKKITAIKILDKKLGETKSFAHILIGNKIIKIDRVGKLLIFALKSGKFLLIHLKMTGQLIFMVGNKIFAGGHEIKINFPQSIGGEFPSPGGVDAPRGRGGFPSVTGGPLPNKYTRLIISFDGRHQLFFNDLRRFGYAKIVSAAELAKIKEGYGIEPLRKDFTLENFKKALSGKKNIKAALLDQAKISGIGNIYADEILFAARIRPSRRVDSLKPAEIENIFSAAGRVIKKAIAHRGTTFSNYVDGSGHQGNFVRFLQVYGRKGEKCQVCGQPIKVVKIAGRSTHFCPHCQK